MINRRQFNQLVYEYNQGASMNQSAMKACVSPNTARKYLLAGQGPGELKQDHTWQTRADPFSEVWREVEVMLGRASELQAGTIFEVLQEKHPGRFSAGQLRTLQRHVRAWKLVHGPQLEVYFPQEQRPGRRVQVDWTSMNALGITMGEQSYPHLLFHMVLPYSNWQWGSRCLSESLLSLRNGLQQGLSNLPLKQVRNATALALGRFLQQICFAVNGQKPCPFLQAPPYRRSVTFGRQIGRRHWRRQIRGCRTSRSGRGG